MQKSVQRILVLVLALITPLASFAWTANQWNQYRRNDPWTLRFRFAQVSPRADADEFITNNSGDDIGGFLTKFDHGKFFEFATTYYFNDASTMEFSFTTTKHETALTGSDVGDYDLAKVDLYLPSITYQIHLWTGSTFSPYIGGGLSYVAFGRNPKLRGLLTLMTISNSFGAIYEGGVDISFGKYWLVNFAVKQFSVSNTVKYQTNEPSLTGNGTEFYTTNNTSPTMFLFGLSYKLEP